MKIKIVKNKMPLVERWQMTSQSSMKYILHGLFRPDNENSIFNKKLIFYDLETNGLGGNAYIHQIAALEFDLGKIFEKHAQGQDTTSDIKNLKATGGMIVKSIFDPEDFEQKDKEIRDERIKFYAINFKRQGKKDPVVFNFGRNTILQKGSGVRFDFDPKNKEPEMIIGASLCITDESWMRNSKKVSDVLLAIETKTKTKIDPITQSIMNLCLEEISSQGKMYQIKRPWKTNPNMSSEELGIFFSKLFELFETLTNAPYTFTAKRGGNHLKPLTKELKHTWSYKKNKAFAMTYTENKNFTEYESFPLERYRDGYGYNAEEARPNEKEGLRKFLSYLKSLGANNYILIGHNIKSFDNSVVLKRAKKYGLPKTLVDYFQNSQALDSLNLLNMYTQQMVWFNNNIETITSDAAISDKAKEVAIESKRKIEEIVKMHKTAKSKLDGMLKVFDITKDKIQTHTADDDCEDLARVLTLAVLDMYSMAEGIQSLRNMPLTPQFTDEIPRYEPKKKVPSKIAAQVKTKLKNDLVQLNIIEPEFAKQFSGKDKENEALKYVVERFASWLVNDYMKEKTELELSREEVFHDLLKFKTQTDTKRAYEKWLTTVKTEKDTDNMQQTQLDFDLKESIYSKWKRLIK